ncbi:MAG: phosphoenolpyruvate carboxylase [Candidatus Brockarchaeota archaeon]|nr:phosphoenolpyruvate carboxylase [Candidatus Brockarchaeota archaeon]
MSTQHPDNANMPFWAKDQEIIQGDDEIYEAYYSFKELECHEQMWDWEGKDVDPNVVRKLLQKFPDFFREKVMGRDVFITYRLPNPNAEVTERKWLLEVLESIPRSYDVAETFYGENANVPIFEVILPLTRSHHELIRIVQSYRKFIVDSEKIRIDEDGCELREWVGEFKPKEIEVIPLIEDKESILKIEEIVGGYIKAIKPKHLRVFIARSDPALNYGLVPAVILSKIASVKLKNVEKETNTRIYSVIGTGVPPFRGNLRPENISSFLKEYESYFTVTIQSALKYDYPFSEVKEVIKKINNKEDNNESLNISSEEEKTLLKVIGKFESEYEATIENIANLVNSLAEYIPNRRARKLHIGLFGYSREIRGIKLPRVISFVSVLYSLGIPPEVIGILAIEKLNEEELKTLEKVYLNLREDLTFAAEYVCYENINLLTSEKEFYENITKKFRVEEGLRRIMEDISILEKNLGIKVGPRSLRSRLHYNLSNNFLISLLTDKKEAKRYVVEAARVRRFLG